MVLYVNRYEFIKDLGRGATGEVKLVKDTKSGFKYALKFLRSFVHNQHTATIQGFQHEFEILKNLSHPNVAKVYDIGYDDISGRYFIATEFVDGKDLFEISKELPLEMIEDLFIQSLRAFNYLHKKKIFHFDIKPQNILVTKEKNGFCIAKVIDFGFANYFERADIRSQKSERHVIGSAAYISPEMLKREPLDERTDLYSLACTFYKAFVGTVPFEDLDVNVVRQRHLEEEPRAPSLVNPKLPKYLDAVFSKMLKKNPNERYSNAQEVIDDINLRTHSSHEIETEETRFSYIPLHGKMVARNKELECFIKYFNDRLLYDLYKMKPILLVSGEPGTGKSRFLEECQFYAKSKWPDLMVMPWKDFDADKAVEYAENETPVLVVGDDASVDTEKLKLIEHQISGKSVLIILTTDNKNLSVDENQIIYLEPFSKGQIKEYLVELSGIKNIPEELINKTYERTQGLPLFMTEYCKACVEQGLLIDKHGNWAAQDLEDFACLFDRLDNVTSFIKNNLRERLKSLEIGDEEKEILYILALTNNPTLGELTEITDAHVIEERLEFLVENNVLKVDVEHQYVFTNPLFKEIFLEDMPPAVKQQYCDAVADYYEQQGRPHEDIIYFRGRGKDCENAKLLLELADIKQQQIKYDEAKENLQALLERDDLDSRIKNQATLKLAELYFEMGQNEKSKKILEELARNNVDDVESLCLTYNLLSRIAQYEGVNEAAMKYCEQGLSLIHDKMSTKWLLVLLQSRLAKTKMNLGNLDEAEKLFLNAWEVWKNELSEEEKIKAIYLNLDEYYITKQDFDSCESYLKKVLNLLENNKHLPAYPMHVVKLARVYSMQGKQKEAEALLKECLNTLKERKVVFYLFSIYNELGIVYYRLHDYEKSFEYYQRACGQAKIQNDEKSEIATILNLGNVCSVTNRLDEAKKYLENALNRMSGPHSYYYYHALLGITEVYLREGNLSEAGVQLDKIKECIKSNNSLAAYVQFYLQHRAVYEAMSGDVTHLKKTLVEIEKLKNTKNFSQEGYREWLTDFDHVKKFGQYPTHDFKQQSLS